MIGAWFLVSRKRSRKKNAASSTDDLLALLRKRRKMRLVTSEPSISIVLEYNTQGDSEETLKASGENNATSKSKYLDRSNISSPSKFIKPKPKKFIKPKPKSVPKKSDTLQLQPSYIKSYLLTWTVPELKDFCLDLEGIFYDKLSGQDKERKIFSLIEHFKEKEEIPELIHHIASTKNFFSSHEVDGKRPNEILVKATKIIKRNAVVIKRKIEY